MTSTSCPAARRASAATSATAWPDRSALITVTAMGGTWMNSPRARSPTMNESSSLTVMLSGRSSTWLAPPRASARPAGAWPSAARAAATSAIVPRPARRRRRHGGRDCRAHRALRPGFPRNYLLAPGRAVGEPHAAGRYRLRELGQVPDGFHGYGRPHHARGRADPPVHRIQPAAHLVNATGVVARGVLEAGPAPASAGIYGPVADPAQ